MSDLISILRAIVRDELRTLHTTDLGIVSRVTPHAEDSDSNNYECSVKLRTRDHEGKEIEINKVPLTTPHAGMVSAPEVGDLVLLAYAGGDAQQPIVLGRLYSAERAAPLHAAKEWRVEAPLGGKTSLAIDKDGAVVIKSGDNTVTIHNSGNIEVTGKKDLTLTVDGNVKLSCKDCAIEASGNIDLGKGGAGVITTDSHRCYYTGTALIGSKTVKAKG